MNLNEINQRTKEKPTTWRNIEKVPFARWDEFIKRAKTEGYIQRWEKRLKRDD